MNILIIGAGGFIGSHLSEKIIATRRDWKITAIDISDTKIAHLLNDENFTYINADVLTQHDVIQEQVSKCDVVFPLAAIANPSIYVKDPLRVFELDFESNLSVVRYAVKYKKRIIFPSTSEVYGMCHDDEFSEDMSCCITGPIEKQRWIYSCSKQMLDRVIYAYGMRDNLSYTLFRPFNWIGPRLDDIKNAENGTSRVLTQFLSNIIHGKDLNLVDGGSQIRCFAYIDDCIDALIKIIENKENAAYQQIFNIGNPNNILSIKELAEKVIALALTYDSLKENASRTKIIIADASNYYGKSYQDVSRRVPSIQKIKNILQWEPHINMDESLKRTLDFYFR